MRKGLKDIQPEDKKFLHQYMTLTRCDLFFADKAVLVEGLSERDLRLRLQKLDPAGAEARARRWAEENAEAIRLNNEAIKRRGVFGADLRRW